MHACPCLDQLPDNIALVQLGAQVDQLIVHFADNVARRTGTLNLGAGLLCIVVGRLTVRTVRTVSTNNTVSTIITIPLQRAGDGQVGGGLWMGGIGQDAHFIRQAVTALNVRDHPGR
ncbi:hypothetical protein D3C84_715170 [compost metagenome]